MRALVACIALVSLSAHADLIARAGKNELHLLDAPCRNEAVLAHIRDEWKDKFRAAHASVNGQEFSACWIDTGQGVYFVAFDDGDTNVFPYSIFRNSGS